MFELSMPWWEFVLRTIAVYVTLLVLIRASGKRSVGQFTPFDLVMVIVLGEAVQNSLLGGDSSLIGGLMIAALLVGLNWSLGWLSAHSRRFDSFLEGKPVLLARRGRVDWDQLKRQKISESDFREAMRKANCLHEHEIRFALLEVDGEITIIRQQSASP